MFTVFLQVSHLGHPSDPGESTHTHTLTHTQSQKSVSEEDCQLTSEGDEDSHCLSFFFFIPPVQSWNQSDSGCPAAGEDLDVSQLESADCPREEEFEDRNSFW